MEISTSGTTTPRFCPAILHHLSTRWICTTRSMGYLLTRKGLKEWLPPLRESTMSIWLIISTLCWLDRPVIQCWWPRLLEIICLHRIRMADWNFGIYRLLRSWRPTSGDTPALRPISMSHWTNWSATAETKWWSWSTWRNSQRRRTTCPRTEK